MRITFKSYDFIEEKFSTMPYKANSWWPDIKDLKKYDPQCKLDVEFLLWILLTNPEPDDPEDKASKKMIQDILYRKLEIIEKPVRKKKEKKKEEIDENFFDDEEEDDDDNEEEE